MKKHLNGLLLAALTAVAVPAAAHHSFAIYDMTQNIEFDGVVESLEGGDFVMQTDAAVGQVHRDPVLREHELPALVQPPA